MAVLVSQRFKVSAINSMEDCALWLIAFFFFPGMTCNLVGVYQKFKETYNLCLRGERVRCATHRQAKLAQKMQTVPYPETSVNF
jgi:hypothetical protein